ncbi:MAG: hypothetical protein SO097_07990, partial [Alistipes shahii]
IVSMLGGTIRLDSKKGKGSRFTVEISMQEAEEQLGYTSNTPVYHNNKTISNNSKYGNLFSICN